MMYADQPDRILRVSSSALNMTRTHLSSRPKASEAGLRGGIETTFHLTIPRRLMWLGLFDSSVTDGCAILQSERHLRVIFS